MYNKTKKVGTYLYWNILSQIFLLFVDLKGAFTHMKIPKYYIEVWNGN